MLHSANRDYEAAEQASDEVRSPLLRPMSVPSINTLCFCGIIGMLAAGWCLMDYWNRQITMDLFNMGDIRMMDLNQDGSPEVIAPFKQFSYPLTLAFLQFVFMGVFFLVLHFSINQERPADLMHLSLRKDKRWPAMVVTHVFSTFWLQALMLPAQMLSIGIFAASRAMEIPATAALRVQVLGPGHGKKNLATVALAFLAACLMFYSYAQLSGCACVWSGNGVALSGFAFWIVYFMLLALPAANAVCQESIMTQPGMHPILLLALQNIFACIIFAPILLFCHLVGWEDVGAAFEMVLTYSEVFMLVLWLCAQMAVTSVLCITLIYMADSFWTITLRALRVVFWAISLLATFSLSDKEKGVPVSIACPRTSLWSFILFASILIGAAAVVSDKPISDPNEDIADKGSAATTNSGKAAAATSASGLN